jgi:hypothetical protein
MAGAKAISESGVDPAGIGVMINTSVSRRYLEPSTAVAVHHALGLPRSCQNFDVTNACLGFVNGMEMAAAMIDAGHGRVRAGRQRRGLPAVQERTIDRLNRPDTVSPRTCCPVRDPDPGLGRRAMVLGRADRHPEGHRLVGSVSRAGTEHHELCIGDNDMMRTDLKGLLDAGLELSVQMWAEAAQEFDWAQGMSRYVMHQVSKVHTEAMCEPVRHRPLTGADDVPDPRQPRPGLGAVHAGRRAGLARRRRPGAAHGHRLGPQRLVPRDRLVRPSRSLPGAPGPGPRLVPHGHRRRRRRRQAHLARPRQRRPDPVGTLLCVHGNPTWSYLWRRLLAAAPPGWRVVAPDQLGMGWSERLPGPAVAAAAGGRPRRPHRGAGRHRPGGHRRARLGRRHLPGLGAGAPARPARRRPGNTAVAMPEGTSARC